MTNEQGWKETLEDLDLRRERSRAMGGSERVARHHGKGKLDARARLEHLLDKGTFREFGTLVGGDIAADGIVAGSGLIDGSPVMVGAEDFATLAGSIRTSRQPAPKPRSASRPANVVTSSPPDPPGPPGPPAPTATRPPAAGRP